jgi:hypothetical protein
MDFAVAASISGGGVRRTRDRRRRRCSLSAVGDNEHDVDGVILEETNGKSESKSEIWAALPPSPKVTPPLTARLNRQNNS